MKVCIVAEGSYPIIHGGLSEWVHLLMRTLKDIQFSVLCIGTTGNEKPVYEKLPNVNQVIIRPIIRTRFEKKSSSMPRKASMKLADSLKPALYGEPLDFETIIELRRQYSINKGWLTSRSYWESLVDFYKDNYNDGPFLEYYWTMFGLYSILLDSINFVDEIPEADVYHALSTGFAGFTASLAKMAYERPLIIIEQGLYLEERRDELSRQNVSEWYRQELIKFSESIVKTSYKYADRIIPPCRSHITLEKSMGANASKIIHINNGIECDKFTPGPSRNGNHKLLVGCFARVVPIKGITTLIKAAKIVLERYTADFVVVGEIQDKAYYAECRELINELGIEEHFTFTGHTNALEWYQRVDVFTLSSNSEGVPYALLEAMSCGLPCICTSVGGMPEIIAEGVGYVVPPNEPQSLAERICEVLGNKELRLKLGRRATEIANDKYTIKEMAHKFRDVYEVLSR